MLKWVYRVWKFRTLRERERERCCGDEFLGCCGFVFYGDDFLVEGIFVGMIFWAVVVFFFGMICGGMFTIVMVVNEFLVQTSV